MNDSRTKSKAHMVSIEMNSTSQVRSIFISNKIHERVLFEGDLGELEKVDFIEDCMLEVRGTNGVLRVELRPIDAEKLIPSLT